MKKQIIKGSIPMPKIKKNNTQKNTKKPSGSKKK